MRMTRWLVWATSLVVVAVVVGWLAAGRTPLPGVAREPAPVVDDLTFTSHRDLGAPTERRLVADEDGLLLVYFGYLSCPDVCPMTMIDIARARRALADEDARRITVAFVTVDPERDDPARLHGYLAHFLDDGFDPMTADADQLGAAVERLGVRYEVEPHAPGDERYEVSHSAITYVVDDSGTLRRELPFGTTAEDIERVMRRLLP
jgi:protein SCO1